ncbi:alpha/beta fold hydrolase [Brevibacterium album]|uniref:alpha/beta fold hydrolase n=1 Tax=Brevibacterium album TaxID=417948 RepID=UPI000424041F|nr:alpha/beta fold hydrolase [Brevibacterium album]
MKEIVCHTEDGFQLAAQTSGPADGKPLLLLQGQANSHVWWDPVRAHFDRQFRVVTFDYRGTGRSRGPIGKWTTAGFADDARSVLDCLGIPRTAVYGTSMGGRIAQVLAATAGERVTALVLACTTPGGPHSVPQAPEVQQELRAAGPEQRHEILRELFFSPSHVRGPEDSLVLGDDTMSAREQAAHRRTSAGHDAWDLLPQTTAPTLVLHGDDDRMNPTENATLLAERIPGARLEITAGGRHGFFIEFAEAVNPLVSAHISAHSHID